jgi:S1-C subfamily serine protease
LLAVSLGWLTLTASAAWADAQTDRFQANAREQLQQPYKQRPYPCSPFGQSGKDGHVVDMTPWAAAAGLRRGDRPVAYGGTRLTGIEDSDGELWTRVAHGDNINILVERAGKELSLQLPCRDDRQRWETYVALGRAISEGRWQDCVDASSRLAKIGGFAPSGNQYTAILCTREKSKSERKPPPDEYWRRIHAWATKAIEESHYRPSGLTEVRPLLLNAIENLEKAGRTTLADDIKQQIAAFSQTPPAANAPVETKTAVQQVGTAFVVRPDGYLLTAFHVVKGTKEIEVVCAEIGKVTALVERFSEANDLAVLRVVGGKTPTYLSLADQRSVNLGEQVFTIGYPAPDILGSEAKFNEGTISSLSVGGDAGYMQISVPVHPGNSGGALLNKSGDVVGVVIATASALNFLKGTGTLPQNVSWAVKGAFAVPLFDQPPRLPAITQHAEVIRRALRATCFITAFVESASPSAAAMRPEGQRRDPSGDRLAGTTWSGVDTAGTRMRVVFESEGRVRLSLANQWLSGTWRQNGDAVYFEVNNAYVTYEGTVFGGAMNGSARNGAGHSWRWRVERE